MAYEADTTQDILKRCFNISLSTLQVTLKGGASIALGSVNVQDSWTTGVHGVRSAISTATIRIAHGTSSTVLKRGMICRAHKDNTTTVYVGFTTLSGETTASTCGQPLLANQSFLIEANNSYSLYAIANATAQKMYYFGM